MMMSDLPEPDRFKLLALGIFMNSGGDRIRPGNAGLAEFGPHKDTWKKLLQRTVKTGWLTLDQRGGARRGPGGTTIRRASMYAASVPREVWERREEILNSPPFRSSGVEGGESVPLKGAADEVSSAPKLKGAVDASFNGSGPSLKRVPVRPLQGNGKDFEGGAHGPSSKSFEGGDQAFEGGPQRPPHHVVTSRTSYPPAPSPVTDLSVVEGGGGQQQQEQTPLASAAAFLESLPAPWTVGAKTAADLAPLLLERATAKGWLPNAALVTKLTERPHGISNYPAVLRIRIEDLPKAPTAPTPRPTAEKPPHCGDIDCDPIDRMREIETPDGIRMNTPCHQCHPSRLNGKQPAA